ncbi:hypothetical protein [Aquimarina sp. AU474]|uniref:hypothetical protein n=1 Tax=Aquimarina sp. AU474 TaxID=2108529 RepID=UPI000D68D7CE|nr:hypothetical protein [Aquimarina sp. AU474]
MKQLNYNSKPPQNRRWHMNSPYNQILFEDDEVELKAKIKVKNGKLKKMKLHLINMENPQSNLYEICAVTRHVNMYIEFPDYILIHVIKSGTRKEQKFKIDGNHIQEPEFDLGKKLTFLFKEYDNTCPNPPTYELPDTTPETKEGSIIIGG